MTWRATPALRSADPLRQTLGDRAVTDHVVLPWGRGLLNGRLLLLMLLLGGRGHGPCGGVDGGGGRLHVAVQARPVVARCAGAYTRSLFSST
jgi:hypothetical protein